MKILRKAFLPFLISCSLASLNSCSGRENNPVENQASSTLQVSNPAKPDTNFHNGDIIFQSSMSGQSYAIRLATHSRYSHCGLLFDDNGKWFVYEAVQPVTKTPVDEWIARGDSGIYVVERLKNADSILTENALAKMRQSVNEKMGRNYDLWFNWSDENIYCSELVWKAYHDATGLEVGKLKKLGEYDLSSPVVQKIMQQRYGKHIPLEEPMISPGNIYDSELLVKVRG